MQNQNGGYGGPAYGAPGGTDQNMIGAPDKGGLRLRRQTSSAYGGLNGSDPSNEKSALGRGLSSIDMYRRVPMELMEASNRGSVFSVLAVFAMAFLALIETVAFMRTDFKQDLKLDSSGAERIRLNFNVTMMDLKCDYVAVDVVTALGNRQNITKNIGKWEVSGDGVRKRFLGRNKQQRDLHADISEDAHANADFSLKVMHQDGVDAIDLDPEKFDALLKSEEYLFVDFFAPWCSWCRLLAPTWEKLAEEMNEVTSGDYDDDQFEEHPNKEGMESIAGKSVTIAKLDCEKYEKYCDELEISAFPQIRLFYKGKKYMRDYEGERTVEALMDYLAAVELEIISGHVVSDEEKKKTIGGEKTKNFFKHRPGGSIKREWHYEDHPGCQISGFIMTDRVPGNFHIEARSLNHAINPKAANLSHAVHHLSFGEPVQRMAWMDVDAKAKLVTSPMDGNVYVTEQKHNSHHHFMKVVATKYDHITYKRFGIQIYQVLAQSQAMIYNKTVVPQARFSYDMSPIAVQFSRKSRHWYDYLTSLLALIGGTFTVIGFFDSSFASLLKKK